MRAVDSVGTSAQQCRWSPVLIPGQRRPNPRRPVSIAAGGATALVMAAWMGDFTPAADFETAYAQNGSWYGSWFGRHDSFDEGHAMLIAGSADGDTNYLVHDPNVFPGSRTSYYGDGTPKGAYRRYSWWELWGTVSRYAKGQALAIVLPAPLPDPNALKGVLLENTVIYDGPGGGHKPRRGVTSEIVPPSER